MATAVADLIDTRSAEYARAWQRVQGGITRLIDKLLTQGRTVDEVIQILGATDFAALAGDLGMAKAGKDLQGAYLEVLRGKVGRGQVTEQTLRAMQSFTRDSFLAQEGAFPAKLKEETIKALLAGGRTSDVEAALRAVVDRHDAATLANTALNTFSRSVEYEMAKQDPPDALYEYEGPVDDRTRDICLAMAAAGALTRSEIEERFPGAFVDGGGYNCRHSWVPSDAARETAPGDAAERLGDREPQTVREVLSGA